jgi:PAS domain S-box-containing protein
MRRRKPKPANRAPLRPPRARAVPAPASPQVVVWTWEPARKRSRWFGDPSPLLGLPPNTFSGRYADYLERLHPQDRAAARRIFVDCLKGRQRTYANEERVVLPDGSVRWLETFGSGEYARNGRCVRMTGVVRDATERRRQQAELAELEERFEKAFDNSQEAIGISRVSDSRIVAVNRRMEQLCGLPAIEMLGRTTLELNFWARTPEIRERILGLLRRDGQIRDMEVGVTQHGSGVRTCIYSAVQIEIQGVPHVIGFLRDVTEQRNAEAQLRQAQASFAAAFTFSPDPIAISRLSDHRLVAVNDAWVRLNGYPRAQALGRTSAELGVWKPGSRAPLLEELKRAGHISYRMVTFVRADGSERQSLVSGAIIDFGGEPCAMWLGRDVSELRRAEQALVDSERRYRTLFDEAIDAIVVISPAGIILDANTVACRDAGYAREELTGQPFQKLLDPAALERYPGSIAQAFAGGAIHAEVNARRKDGGLIPVEIRAGRLPDGNVLAFVREVSDRRRAEAMLANLARGVTAELGDAFFQSLVNHLCRELPADHAFIGEVVPPARERVRTLAFCRDGAPAPNFEYPLEGSPCINGIEKRGTVVYAENVADQFPRDTGLRKLGAQGYVGTSLQNARGETIGILVALSRRAISRPAVWTSILEIFAARAAAEIERAAAERRIRELNLSLERRVAERTAELEAANRELESFSYSVSHDLRAPLRAVAGFAAMLRGQHGAALPEAGRHQLERIEANAARMGALIDDLLKLSRASMQELKRRPTDMEALARMAAHEATEHAARHVEVQIHPLPQVQGDHALLRQVWANLIGNAVKYSRGVHAPRIEIGAQRLDKAVEYYVRDNGAGFDPQHAARLFGLFQRLHSEEEFEGTGVGLALVERIVRRHGGTVSAEGAPGSGATFRFSLPT